MPTRSAQMIIVCLLAAVAALLGGCLGGGRAAGAPAAPGPIAVGQSTQSIEFGGITRTFHLYRPQGLPDPAPLVVMLHGGYGDGAQAERAYHWDSEADGGHFLVAYPDGLDRAWNAGSCCGRPQRASIDDVGFLSAMVAAIEQQVPVDPARVYVTGMSNGAMMALRLGCQTSLFAAVAPVAGTLLTDCSQAPPTSVLQINGTADDRVPYNGGPGKATTMSGTPIVDGPAVASVNATWRAIDNCPAPTSSSAGDVTTQTAECPDGRTVELISIAGAGHQWPGGVPNPAVERLAGLPPPSAALNATDTIWQFFSAHHR
ncbi:polyhydroxybutyrate depolymerase [Mycolicibacterium sp. CH28]|uniref:extracellular catalytic domain type 1 short-chain-length polyhydroxyalkanoate depolymerase n=1 Tax=Mycolicibacterium sp. CH28 TaxID=2512237 RepID=UPI00107FE314|nr:PHB depolymerase family esterase [Mycolicibacterium sp. CH28]TGD84607.1 polyhydroxybutyrate depolymerase [Mycolicibacterium sp. CH28]